MSDEPGITLASLAEAEFEARMRVEHLNMMNIGALSYQDQKKLAVECAEARRAHAEARSILEKAIATGEW